MNRHSILARLGPTDTSIINVHVADSIISEIRFIDGHRRLKFGLGQMLDQLAERGIIPTESAIDLAILAAVVMAADTHISRSIDAQDSWTREIDLYIPVHDMRLWELATKLLERMLKFLTGDHWRLFFRERHQDYNELVIRPTTLVEPSFSSICLFSGGLDSFVGAIDLLGSKQNPLLVSHYWDLSTSSQELCANRIGAIFGDIRPRHIRARIGFTRNDFNHAMHTESTTRSRSFLFIALAALAASGLSNEPTIYIPENGLISLNVPLDPLRVGALSTRTTHPFYLARWQELLGILGITGTLENPYRFRTKGEMLSGCTNTALVQHYVGETISCSSISKARWRGLAPQHCGFCVPCLIRRAAIIASFGTDPTSYTISGLHAGTLNSFSSVGEHIRSFQMMARRLSQERNLEHILIHKSGPLSDYPDNEIVQYAGVFRRGIEEVARLIHNVIVRPS